MSARDTPSIRIVFRTVCLVDLSQEADLLNTNLMWDVRKALPVTWARKVTVGQALQPVGFGLAGLLEVRQAETCPTQSASGLVRGSSGIAGRARAARRPDGRYPAGANGVRRQSPWRRARPLGPSPPSESLRRLQSFFRPRSAPVSGRRFRPDLHPRCSSARKSPPSRDSTFRTLPAGRAILFCSAAHGKRVSIQVIPTS